MTAGPEGTSAFGADLVGRALADQGIRDLFFMMGIGGSDSRAVKACLDRGINAYYVRHEEAAAMAAHAYARLTRRAGVCITPLGPATTNAITGLANARLDAAPVVLLGGGPGRDDWGRQAYQEQDLLGMVRPACKAVFRAELPERIPELIAIAIREAEAGRKGPVYLELPLDVLRQPVDETGVTWPESPGEPIRPGASAEDLAAVVDLLGSAERPVVLAGSGVIWSGACADLAALVEASGLPLVTTPQARGTVPEDHPLVLTASRNRAMREADAVLVIGTRANWINGHLQPPRFAAGARFAVINLDPEEIVRGRPGALGLVGDARTIVRQLSAGWAGRALTAGATAWISGLQARDAAVVSDPAASSNDVPIHPLRLCAALKEALPRDAVFIVDGHETLEFARRAIPSLSEGNYLTSGPNGCMGIGVPFALGAKVACPDRPVFVLMGDGAFGWNGMEYDTLIRHRLPVVGVVFNNAGFTSRPRAGEVGRELGYQRYDVMIEAFGGHGEFVREPDELKPALMGAIDSGLPALVNVCVDRDIPAPGGLEALLG